MNVVGAVTAIGPDYEKYAECAATAFKQHTGCEVQILGGEHRHLVPESLRHSPKHSGMWLKLHAFDLIPEPDALVIFDCDLRFMRSWSPEDHAAHGEICVCHDRSWEGHLHEVCYKDRLNPWTYFNSGLMIVPRAWAWVFAAARHAWFSIPHHYHDQGALNLVIQRLRVPLRWLSEQHNWLASPADIDPKKIIGLHSAGPVYAHWQSLLTITDGK